MKSGSEVEHEECKKKSNKRTLHPSMEIAMKIHPFLQNLKWICTTKQH